MAALAQVVTTMPLVSGNQPNDDGGMAFSDSGTQQQQRARTVLLAGPGDVSWNLVPIRFWDRVRAHLGSPSLDAQLAAGEPTDTDRLRAVRAVMLVAPAKRRQLARGWQGVLRPGLSAPSVRQSVVEARRSEVLAALDEIHELIGELAAERPVAARGVAVANLLLTDGTGPLYNAASPGHVRDEIRDALHHLHLSRSRHL